MTKANPPRLAPDDALYPIDDLAPEVVELLDFSPVPRQVNRPDGWTPDRQKRFIVLLAETGSPQRAAIAMGKQLSGVEGVYRDDEDGGFREAWGKALAIGAARQRGIDAALGGGGDRTPPHRRGETPGSAPPDPGPASEMSYDDRVAVFHNIYRKYMLKVEEEREARLAGEVVTADFTLRQLTCIEVMLDLMALKLSGNAWEMLRDARMGEHGPLAIAETDMSRCLDAARREVWAEMDEPDRPEYPPRRYLKGYEGYSTEPSEVWHGGTDEVRAAEVAARAKQHREDAAAQVEWESSQRRAYEERRDRDAS